VFRLPSSQSIEPISKQVTIIVGLTVVGFMAFGLTLSFYRNILFEQTLAEMEAQNKLISKDIERGERDVAYFQSEQYKDKYAKENLGKLNPGEKVIIITRNPAEQGDAAADPEHEEERREAAYQELLRQMPVQQHWSLYLFHPEKIEELRKGL
jgi:cell division protein FtsB